MNSNNDCSCDANKFYEKYKDRIEVILSQRFTDVSIESNETNRKY